MFNIREASISDLAELTALFDSYRVFYGMQSDIIASTQFLSDRINNHDSIIFIAEKRSKLKLGFVQLYPLFSSTRMKRLWLLNDLYVAEKYRTNGVSTMLISECKSLCKLTNACGLVLETAKSNSIANSLYVKAGFNLDNEHNYYEWRNTESSKSR